MVSSCVLTAHQALQLSEALMGPVLGEAGQGSLAAGATLGQQSSQPGDLGEGVQRVGLPQSFLFTVLICCSRARCLCLLQNVLRRCWWW